MPQDRGGKNRKVCDWLMQAPFFEGFSCQPHSSRCCQLLQEDSEGFFPSVPPFLHCPSPLVFMEIWLPNPFQIHIINSTRPLMWDHVFAKGEEMQNSESGLPHAKTIGKANQRQPLCFCFSTDRRSRHAAAIRLIRPSE